MAKNRAPRCATMVTMKASRTAGVILHPTCCRPASGSVTSDRPPPHTSSGWPVRARRGGRSFRCTHPAPEIRRTRRFPPLPAMSFSSAPIYWSRTVFSSKPRWPRFLTFLRSGWNSTRSEPFKIGLLRRAYLRFRDTQPPKLVASARRLSRQAPSLALRLRALSGDSGQL